MCPEVLRRRQRGLHGRLLRPGLRAQRHDLLGRDAGAGSVTSKWINQLSQLRKGLIGDVKIKFSEVT